MYRILLIAVTVCLGICSLKAQNQSFDGYIEAGDTAVAKKDYYNAYRMYSIASDDDWSESRGYEERVSEVFYKAGLAAYKATAYVPAEQYFLRLISRPDANSFALAKFYLAQSTFRQGMYDQAVVFYEQFLEEQTDVEEVYRQKASLQISEADWAIERMSRGSDIQLRHLPPGINTEDSDVMYVRGPKGTRYFSSNNFEYKGDKLLSKRLLSRIMQQTGNDSARPLPATINVPGKNVAHTAFNNDMTKVYYSVCEWLAYDELNCDIYAADVDLDGKWSNPQKQSINLDNSSTSQPSYGSLAADGKDYLYFTSNRPGGKGGYDLYRANVADDGSLGAVERLDDLNTSDDDVSPFWYAKWQTLYFSTNGRFSFGGMDIYKSFNINGRFMDPVNLGTPVNSSADEAYYTRFDDPGQAYVASRNATGEALYYSDTRDVCCYDLYEFEPDPRITLRVLTINKLTADELPGATVKLHKITSDGPQRIDEITNFDQNVFNFQVEPGQKYQLEASLDGFTSVTDEFDLSTEEFKDVPFIQRVLPLVPKVDLDVFTYNNVDGEMLPNTPVTLYELTESGIRIKVNDNVSDYTNDTHFELEIGKRYLVIGKKLGYGEDSEIIDLRDYNSNYGSDTRRVDLYLGQLLDVYVIDAKTEMPLMASTVTLTSTDVTLGDPETNMEGNDFHYVVNLNQDFTINVTRRGYFPRSVPLRFTKADIEQYNGRLSVTVPMVSDDINEFLDLRVYFDNDHPDPDAYRSTTRLAYDDTYAPYVARREVFVSRIAKGLRAEEGFLVSQEVNEFFDEQVIPGYNDLLKLADALVVHMENGRSYQINMVGYASPRAPDYYNMLLSARRNVSLRNFFKRYQDGILSGYMKSGRLTFTSERRGEEKDLGRIYELIEEERVSIFSVEASLERRVEFPKIFTTNSRK